MPLYFQWNHGSLAIQGMGAWVQRSLGRHHPCRLGSRPLRLRPSASKWMLRLAIMLWCLVVSNGYDDLYLTVTQLHELWDLSLRIYVFIARWAKLCGSEFIISVLMMMICKMKLTHGSGHSQEHTFSTHCLCFSLFLFSLVTQNPSMNKHLVLLTLNATECYRVHENLEDMTLLTQRVSHALFFC